MRLYKLLTLPTPRIPRFSLTYIVVSLLFVALGGCFAVAWNEDRAWKCLGIGAAFPLIVSSLALNYKTGRGQ